MKEKEEFKPSFIRNLEPPFNAYKGDDPCLFVSYAHKDKALVYPIIRRLNLLGVRIWYDEGIPPSKNWIKSIATTLRKCTAFLVFISPNAIASDHVNNEIHFAIKHKKQFFQVYLKPTTLPDELDFQISRLQALFWYGMKEERFWEKLLDQLEEVTDRDSGKTFEEIKAQVQAGVITGEDLMDLFLRTGGLSSDQMDELLVLNEKYSELFKAQKKQRETEEKTKKLVEIGEEAVNQGDNLRARAAIELLKDIKRENLAETAPLGDFELERIRKVTEEIYGNQWIKKKLIEKKIYYHKKAKFTRILTPEDYKTLNSFLQEFFLASDEYEGIVLLSFTGEIIISALPPGLDFTNSAKNITDLLAVCECFEEEFRKGKTEVFFVSGSNGFILNMIVGTNLILSALINATTSDLASTFLTMKATSTKILGLLQSRPASKGN